MLICFDLRLASLPVGDDDRRDLLSKPSASLRCGCALLAAQGKCILDGAGHLKVLRDVLAGIRH